MAIRIPDGRFPQWLALQSTMTRVLTSSCPDLTSQSYRRATCRLDSVKQLSLLQCDSHTRLWAEIASLGAFLLTDAEGKRVPEAGETAARPRSAYEAASGAGAEVDRRNVIYYNIALLADYAGRRGDGGGGEIAVPEFFVFAEADYVEDVLQPWPSLTARQIENTYAGILSTIWDGDKLAFEPLTRFVTAVPLPKVLGAIASAAAAEDQYGCCCSHHQRGR